MRNFMSAGILIIDSAGASHAISVSSVGPTLANAQAAEAAFLAGRTVAASETFEADSFVKGSRGTSFTTGVGTFTDNSPVTIHGGTGIGILPRPDNTSPFGGRFNTTPGGSKWLDSFDSSNVSLSFNLPSSAIGIGFYLTDLDDVSADMKLQLLVDNVWSTTFDLTPNRQSNGTAYYVSVLFGNQNVAGLRITNTVTNDGWGIDDLKAVAAVPLPAAGWMLVAGLAALAALRRRKA